MKNIFLSFCLLAGTVTSASALAAESVTCSLTAMYPSIPAESKEVKIVLTEPGYRDLQEGSATLSMNGGTIPGVLGVRVWNGHGGPVTENSISLGGFKVENAGMHFSLTSDGSVIKVDCQLK